MGRNQRRWIYEPAYYLEWTALRYANEILIGHAVSYPTGNSFRLIYDNARHHTALLVKNILKKEKILSM